MENFLIPRRFVRIKALQNLYAYTISKKAHKKEAIEQVKKDFMFDRFLDQPDQKEQLEKEQKAAVALFCEAAATTPATTKPFSYAANQKIEQSVGRHLVHYVHTLKQDQMLLQNSFKESKESIYKGLLYALLLLIEWYKLAKKEYTPSKKVDYLLKNQLAQDPLLEELYYNSNWANVIYKNGVSWGQDLYQVQNWYRQFIQHKEVPKAYRSDANNNSVKLLEYLLQDIIFQKGPINDFLAMADLYWDEHKRMVKKFLNRIFMMRSTKDFSTFTLFWHNLEPKWEIEAAFYNRLLTIVIQNSAIYEAMIGEKAQKWDSARILLIDKLILKLALAELFECKEVPFKVAINEYIEIAKWYGTTKSGLFINGVLEGILKGVNR